MRTIMLAIGLLASNAAASDTLAPWSSKTEPGDAPKNHTEQIAGAGAAKHTYTVMQGGTMDGENCRSPLGVGMNREGVSDQPWESNRFVRLENVGDTDVINPWLSNGRNTFRNFGEVLASAVAPGMSDKEKALALWFQEIQFRYHAAGDNKELGDPVKLFNSYGHNTCGNDSICLAGLWQKAGLKAAPARGVGHCITQVFYEDRWHLLDAPNYPVEATLVFDEKRNEGILHWKPNPDGRTAVKYRIYGSDEKGFSVSDVPYKVDIGTTRDLTTQFPANFIAETGEAELAVLGPKVKLPNANKTYYRVVAVDEQGKRSGPSDYATAPRPVIYSEPPTAARVGGDYHYQPSANRSLGDLKAREVNGAEVRAFFEIESPKYTLAKGPAWLKLDPATGILLGKPEAAGKFEVSILATIEREQRKLDEGALVWGNYKLLGTSIEKLASAPQSFVIDVAP